MNKVLLTGRISHDVRLLGTEEKPYAIFNLAVKHPFRGKDAEALFIPIRAQGKDAEFVSKWCKKGSVVEVEAYINVVSKGEGQDRTQTFYFNLVKIDFGLTSKSKDVDVPKEEEIEEVEEVTVESKAKSKKSNPTPKVEAECDIIEEDLDDSLPF